MTPKPVVLVATDFSSIGDHAIDNAAHLVRHFNGKVTLLHVVNKESRKKLKLQKQPIESLKAKMQAEVDKIRQLYSVEANFLIREGSIFTTIADVAKEISALYLVIGTHGKKGIQFLLGSFIMKVIKRSPVPAFSIKKSAEGNAFKNVVYPLDLSLGSKQKVKWAVHFNKLVGAHYHIFVENPGLNSLRIKLRSDLNLVIKIMEQYGIRYSVSHAQGKGPFYKQILNFTQESNADFIMLSTDPGKITWALFGSDDEKLIYNKEGFPVMCINSKDLNVIIGGM